MLSIYLNEKFISFGIFFRPIYFLFKLLFSLKKKFMKNETRICLLPLLINSILEKYIHTYTPLKSFIFFLLPSTIL